MKGGATKKGITEKVGEACKTCGKPLWVVNGEMQKCPVCFPKEDKVSLRDRFAMAVLTGLITAAHKWDFDKTEEYAKCAYIYADAMLAERKKEGGK